MICGARTKDGPCQDAPEPNKRRCRIHGGASTGPRTEAGKARLAVCRSEIAIRRWAETKAAGRSRLGDLSLEGLLALKAFNKGRPKSAATIAKMSETHKDVQREKRIQRYRRRIQELAEAKEVKCH